MDLSSCTQQIITWLEAPPTKYQECLDSVEPASSGSLRDAKAPIHYENSMRCMKRDSMLASVWGP